VLLQLTTIDRQVAESDCLERLHESFFFVPFMVRCRNMVYMYGIHVWYTSRNDRNNYLLCSCKGHCTSNL